MNKPIEQVEVQLLRLANWGFLVYNFETKVAIVKDKLTDYVNAQAGKADYDVIFFNSFVTNAANGVLGSTHLTSDFRGSDGRGQRFAAGANLSQEFGGVAEKGS